MAEPSRHFSSYELEKRLPGSAGSGVYVASDGGAQRILSFVSLDDAQRERIEAELERCASLRHPAVLRALGLEDDGERTALVYPMVDGRTLARLGERLSADGEWIADVAIWRIGHQVACALAAAHRLAGDPPIVHGGLSPHQIICTWEGHVRVSGFGASPAIEPCPSAPFEGFAAPEVRSGGAMTPSANTYALGALLWWLLTREPPPAEPAPIGERRSDLPKPIARAIDRALSLEPEARGRCAMLSGALNRHQKGGQEELRWNMEVFRALDVLDDELPTSLAFPSSEPADEEAAHAPSDADTPPPRTSSTEPRTPKKKSTLASMPSEERPSAGASSKVSVQSAVSEPPVSSVPPLSEPPSSDDFGDAATQRLDRGMFAAVAGEDAEPSSERTQQVPMDELERQAEHDARDADRAKKERLDEVRHLLEDPARAEPASPGHASAPEDEPPPEEAPRASGASSEAPMFPEPGSPPRSSDEDITREMRQGELAERIRQTEASEAEAPGRRRPSPQEGEDEGLTEAAAATRKTRRERRARGTASAPDQTASGEEARKRSAPSTSEAAKSTAETGVAAEEASAEASATDPAPAGEGAARTETPDTADAEAHDEAPPTARSSGSPPEAGAPAPPPAAAPRPEAGSPAPSAEASPVAARSPAAGPADPSSDAFPTPAVAPPPADAPPTKRRVRSHVLLALAVAATAVVFFAAGLWIVSASKDEPDGETPQSAAPAPPDPGRTEVTPGSPTATAAAPGEHPTATTTSDPAAEDASTSSPEEPDPENGSEDQPQDEDENPPEDESPPEDEPKPGHGFLTIEAPIADAGVYVQGEHVGMVGERIQLPCARVFVRIGNAPLSKWYNSGRTVHVPCGEGTTVQMSLEDDAP